MSTKITLQTFLAMSEEDARAFLERLRWPDGPVCPHCGVVGNAARFEPKPGPKGTSARPGTWFCRACRKQFSVTVGTIFEGSHVKLALWLGAFFLLGSAKKSVSARQVGRQLGLGSYRTAWHLCHRIRAAMANGGPLPPLRGIVEADETWVGGKLRPRAGGPDAEGETRTQRIQRAQAAWRAKRVPVAVLVSREGGARARALSKVGVEELGAFIRGNVDVADATLHTDEHNAYVEVGREFAGGHEAVNHGKKEYARPGGVHSNTAESFHALFKRAYHGSWHHVSAEHIGRYLEEAAFRWSHREEGDGGLTLRAIKQGDGVRLYYKQPKGGKRQDEEPRSLVAGE